ncbi:unnamed protein product [Gemmata massiliana]|uniref:Uncharacterized protein n=1 Tax=Gemmata massiliana TaxID=1210884 RepID=A0A6P2CQ96_9BACT|nr:hypothetical protein [Gemmata massiliana]VTR91073.1 unnamed protein product [Gemmata massiliana]
MTREASVLLVAVLLATGSTANDNPKTPDEAVKVLRDGLKIWAAAERAAVSYRCRMELFVSGTAKGKTVIEKTNSVCLVTRAGDKIAIQIEKYDSGKGGAPTTSEDKAVLNDDYMFAIRKNRPESPWTLTKFSRSNRETDFWQVVGGRRTALHPLTADNISELLTDILNNPTFQISSVKTRPDGLVDVVCYVKTGDDKHPVTHSGTLTLSPNHGYVIVGYDRVLTFTGGQYREQCTRVLSDPSEPLRCRSLKFTFTDVKTGEVRQRDQFDFTDVSAEPVPDDQFFLPAYGIPEPGDVDALPVPVYYTWKFWTGIGAVCFVLMLVFRRLARR